HWRERSGRPTGIPTDYRQNRERHFFHFFLDKRLRKCENQNSPYSLGSPTSTNRLVTLYHLLVGKWGIHAKVRFLEALARFHANRIAGGNRYYRYPYWVALARRAEGPRCCCSHAVHEQSQADGVGHPQLQ